MGVLIGKIIAFGPSVLGICVHDASQGEFKLQMMAAI